MKKVEGDRCLVFAPEDSGSHPVLCFLHGAGEAATDSNGKPQSLAKVLENGSPAWHADRGSAFVSRFLVICPQLERRRRWESSDAPWVESVVQAVVRVHSGDLSRLTLTGFSYGGEGAFQIASAGKLALADHLGRGSSAAARAAAPRGQCSHLGPPRECAARRGEHEEVRRTARARAVEPLHPSHSPSAHSA